MDVAFQPGFYTYLIDPQRIGEMVRAEITALDAPRSATAAGTRPKASYAIVRGSAVIPVMGSLLPYGSYLGSSRLTSYEDIREALRGAKDDPNVSRIVLHIDSPGGAVAGIDAAANAVAAAAKKKRVVAVVGHQAASAAYWLASQATEIVMLRLAEVGSIGVVRAHVDVSKALDQSGLKITLMYAGAKKVDGNPFEPLSDQVRAEETARLETLRREFARSVAAGRPAMDMHAVLATEADIYGADEAIVRGLADRIGSLEDVLEERV